MAMLNHSAKKNRHSDPGCLGKYVQKIVENYEKNLNQYISAKSDLKMSESGENQNSLVKKRVKSIESDISNPGTHLKGTQNDLSNLGPHLRGSGSDPKSKSPPILKNIGRNTSYKVAIEKNNFPLEKRQLYLKNSKNPRKNFNSLPRSSQNTSKSGLRPQKPEKPSLLLRNTLVKGSSENLLKPEALLKFSSQLASERNLAKNKKNTGPKLEPLSCIKGLEKSRTNSVEKEGSICQSNFGKDAESNSGGRRRKENLSNGEVFSGNLSKRNLENTIRNPDDNQPTFCQNFGCSTEEKLEAENRSTEKKSEVSRRTEKYAGNLCNDNAISGPFKDPKELIEFKEKEGWYKVGNRWFKPQNKDLIEPKKDPRRLSENFSTLKNQKVNQLESSWKPSGTSISLEKLEFKLVHKEHFEKPAKDFGTLEKQKGDPQELSWKPFGNSTSLEKLGFKIVHKEHFEKPTEDLRTNQNSSLKTFEDPFLPLGRKALTLERRRGVNGASKRTKSTSDTDPKVAESNSKELSSDGTSCKFCAIRKKSLQLLQKEGTTLKNGLDIQFQFCTHGNQVGLDLYKEKISTDKKNTMGSENSDESQEPRNNLIEKDDFTTDFRTGSDCKTFMRSKSCPPKAKNSGSISEDKGTPPNRNCTSQNGTCASQIGNCGSLDKSCTSGSCVQENENCASGNRASTIGNLTSESNSETPTLKENCMQGNEANTSGNCATSIGKRTSSPSLKSPTSQTSHTSLSENSLLENDLQEDQTGNKILEIIKNLTVKIPIRKSIPEPSTTQSSNSSQTSKKDLEVQNDPFEPQEMEEEPVLDASGSNPNQPETIQEVPQNNSLETISSELLENTSEGRRIPSSKEAKLQVSDGTPRKRILEDPDSNKRPLEDLKIQKPVPIMRKPKLELLENSADEVAEKNLMTPNSDNAEITNTDSGYYSGNKVLEKFQNSDTSDTETTSEGSTFEVDSIIVPNVKRTLSERNPDDDKCSALELSRSYSLPLPPKSDLLKTQLKKGPTFEENLDLVSSRQNKEHFIPLQYDNVIYHLVEQCPVEAINVILMRKLSEDVPDVVYRSKDNCSTSEGNVPIIRYSKDWDTQGRTTYTIYDQESNPMLKDVDLRIPKLPERSPDIPEKTRRKSRSLERDDQRKNNSGPRDCTMKMLNIIKEVKDTEKTYVNSLKVIVEEYLPMIDGPNVPPAIVGKRNLIFSNIAAIYQYHKNTFYPELNQCDDVKRIASCFLKHKRLFEMYPEYCRNERKGDKLANDYNSFFEQKQKDLRDPFNLASYLLTPVQRLGKYILLLQSFLKECDKNGFQIIELKKALAIVQYNMNRGNDLISLDDIQNCKMSLNDLGAIELRDEFLVYTKGYRNPLDSMVFFFEHAIVITRIKRENKSETYSYFDHIALRDLGYTLMQENPLDFEIWLRRQDQKISYILRAKSRNQKLVWDKKITEKLWKQLMESRKKAPNIKIVPKIPIHQRSQSEIQMAPERPNLGSTHSLKNPKRKNSTTSTKFYLQKN